MGKLRLALEPQGPKRVELRWRLGFRDFRVVLNDNIWPVERAPLDQGAYVQLPDGSVLMVKVVRRRWWSTAIRSDLHVELNGVPLPGSDGHSRVIVRRAARLVGALGLLEVLFAALLAAFTESRLQRSIAGLVVLEGLMLLPLAGIGMFGMRVAILLAAILIAVDTVVAAGGAGVMNPAAILVRGLVIWNLLTAWNRARDVGRLLATTPN